MKRVTLVLMMFFVFSNIAFTQTATEKVKELAKNKDFTEATAFIPMAVKESPKDERFMILCGDIYFDLEKLDSALIMYRKADDIKSNQSLTMRKIGKVLSLKKNNTEAIEILKDAVKRYKEDPNCYLELAQAFIRADSMRQADFNIRKAIELDKSNADAYVALGDYYFPQKVYELAKENYEKALSINEDLTEARERLATAYYWMANREFDETLRQEYYERSLKEWNIVTKKDPKNAKAFYEQGKIFYLSGQFKPAAQSLYQYVSLRPDGSLGRWWLAQSLYELGSCDSAAPQLRLVSEQIDSVKIKARLLLARCYFDRKMYKESAEVFAKFPSPDSLDLEDVKRYASATLNSGDTTTAITCYLNAVKRDPTNCKFLYDVGRFLMFVKKDGPTAIEVFKVRMINCQDSLSPTINYLIGYGFVMLESQDSAYVYFKRSLAVNPDDLRSNLYLGDVYAKLGIKDSAKIQFEIVIEKGKGDVEKNKWELTQAFFKWCSMVFEQKKYTELNKASKKWTETLPDSEYGWLYYGISFQAQSDQENACKYYRKVLQINKENKQAKEFLKKLNCQ
ncbi:MAG: tetratricopeptide repeat protein [Bacteroidota bacterium]